MKKILFFLLINILFQTTVSAQLENVYVETYYVSDSNDATDTLGGGLEAGSVTYRIFLDLSPGSKLLRIYGDENHPLSFTSTAPFFNHEENNVSLANELSKNRFDEGTTVLDTWLTIGQISKPFSSTAYFGQRKINDTDGSIIGGINNDGGSQEISGGILNNVDSEAGMPLTSTDGMYVSGDFPIGLMGIGFVDPLSGEDSSIFGSVEPVLEFYSNTAIVLNEGFAGSEGTNEIIIAQLTTAGDITFDINLEIEFEEDGVTKVVKYVANDDVLEEGEEFNALLSYPWTCGCKDANFLEASNAFACEDDSKCVTPIVLGCMDSMACNFDPAANYNVEGLCCYIGYCNDRDISLVCPELPIKRAVDLANLISLYPNPTKNEFTVELTMAYGENIPFAIYDAYSRKIFIGELDRWERKINIPDLSKGVYYVQFLIDNEWVAKPIVKN